MHLRSIAKSFPSHYYDQETLLTAFQDHWSSKHYNPDRLARLHKNVLVGGRYLALPLEAYPRLETWGQANDKWIDVGLDIGEVALQKAVSEANLEIHDVSMLITVSVTGIATPSLDARLMNRLELRPDLKRLPIFGLGCVAGAAGIARAADYLKAYPDEIAVLLSVELCSLTLQRQNLSIPNLIASGLFGDGAAAVVLAGQDHPTCRHDYESSGPEIVATRSVFYPGTEHVMGWDISENGFGIILSADVPRMAHDHLCHDVDLFLCDHKLDRTDITSWICHPGGPKVLESIEKVLDLKCNALDITWKSLREIGNISSASVLMVLHETMYHNRPPTGSWGVLLAMGPGFCSEFVLLRW